MKRAWHVIRREREDKMMKFVQKVSEGTAHVFHTAVKATKKGVHETVKTAHKAVGATKKAIRRYR
jgi:hypothetical protein